MRRAGHADSYLGRAQVGARRLARGGRERGGDRRNGRHLAKWPLASAGTAAPKALAVDATGASATRYSAAIGNEPSTFRYLALRLIASSAVVTERSVTWAPSST